MSNSTPSAPADTFVSTYSGATFPVSEKIDVVDYGPIASSETRAADAAQALDDSKYYLAPNMSRGWSSDGELGFVSPGCTWEKDPAGFAIHPDACIRIYVKTACYRWRRSPAYGCRFDTRIYQDTYDSRYYWAPDFPVRTDIRNYSHVSTYNIHHNFTACAGCGQLFPNSQLVDGYCADCRAARDEEDDDEDEFFENLEDSDGRISGYGNREYPPVRAITRKVKGAEIPVDPVLLGVELEVEVGRDNDRNRIARQIANACRDTKGRFIIMKEDGSLNYGIEIVSAPMDISHHKTLWGPLFDRLQEQKIRGLKAWTTTTAGMHVHVSREPLSCLQVGKVVVFANAPKNKAFMTAVAGRDANNYTKFVESTKLITGHRGYGGDRYCSVNLCNAKTIEFRIFKATLNRARFLANIQFCHALVQYCAPCDRSISASIDHAQFCSWVRKHRKMYPALDDLLVRKGFLTPAKIGKGLVAQLVTVDSD